MNKPKSAFQFLLAALVAMPVGLQAQTQENKPTFVQTPVKTPQSVESLKNEASKPLSTPATTKWDKLFFDGKTQGKLGVKGLDPKAMGQGAWGSGDGALRADGSIVLYDLLRDFASGGATASACASSATLIPKSAALEDLGFDYFDQRAEFPPMVAAKALIKRWDRAQTFPNPLLRALDSSLDQIGFFWIESASLPAKIRLPVPQGYEQSLTLVTFMDPIGIVASRPLWNRLDGCSQTGLMLHEAFRHMKAVLKYDYSEEQLREIVRFLLSEKVQELPKTFLIEKLEMPALEITLQAMVFTSLDQIASVLPKELDSTVTEPRAVAALKQIRTKRPDVRYEFVSDLNQLVSLHEGLKVIATKLCQTESEKRTVEIESLVCDDYLRRLGPKFESTGIRMALNRAAQSLAGSFGTVDWVFRSLPLRSVMDDYQDYLHGRLTAKDRVEMVKLIGALKKASEAQDGSALFALYVTQIARANSEK